LPRGNLICRHTRVPPSGGSLEIGNTCRKTHFRTTTPWSSPFGGIPRNWKRPPRRLRYSLGPERSPFGGIPRNWKQGQRLVLTYVGKPGSPFGGIPRNWKRESVHRLTSVIIFGSPFGGIPRNWKHSGEGAFRLNLDGSPFGGIPRNWKPAFDNVLLIQGAHGVPPSGGSLEIGNIGE